MTMTNNEAPKGQDAPKRIWPIGFYAPGSYACKCAICGANHIAAKRAVRCADCTLQAAYRTLSDTRNLLTAAQARAEQAEAERAAALHAKDCFQRTTRAHWEALCAMRNSINEYVPMPNTDSGPLFSPEDGPIYADIAERVIAAIRAAQARERALLASNDEERKALVENASLRHRLKAAEAELARVINIAAGLFAGGFDNNVALIRAALREGGDNG
jgi:hypothetical protein